MAEMYRDQVTKLTDKLGEVAAPVALLAELGADDCADHGEADSAATLFAIYYEYELGRLAEQQAGPDTVFATGFLRYRMGECYFASGQRYDAQPLLRESLAELAGRGPASRLGTGRTSSTLPSTRSASASGWDWRTRTRTGISARRTGSSRNTGIRRTRWW
jgi:hypothetical protein